MFLSSIHEYFFFWLLQLVMSITAASSFAVHSYQVPTANIGRFTVAALVQLHRNYIYCLLYIFIWCIRLRLNLIMFCCYVKRPVLCGNFLLWSWNSRFNPEIFNWNENFEPKSINVWVFLFVFDVKTVEFISLSICNWFYSQLLIIEHAFFNPQMFIDLTTLDFITFITFFLLDFYYFFSPTI